MHLPPKIGPYIWTAVTVKPESKHFRKVTVYFVFRLMSYQSIIELT